MRILPSREAAVRVAFCAEASAHEAARARRAGRAAIERFRTSWFHTMTRIVKRGPRRAGACWIGGIGCGGGHGPLQHLPSVQETISCIVHLVDRGRVTR